MQLLGWVIGGILLAQDAPKVETVKIPRTKVSFEVVPLPGGTYRLGVPGKEGLRDVPLKPFAIGRREVTWKEFDLYYDPDEPRQGEDGVTRPSKGKPYFEHVFVPNHFLNAPRPATCLRWHSAVGYCDWLSRQTGDFYRLPTEAEWEAACRAGSKEKTMPNLEGHAWFGANGEKSTHDAGMKKPNALGLYDMLGNVWEYCLDHHEEPVFSPVLRGGGFSTPENELTFSSRSVIPPKWFEADPQRPKSVWWLTNEWHQGFRVVRVPNATVESVRKVYAGKIKITVGKMSEPRRVAKWNAYFTRFTGEIRNDGNRTLDEVELLAYHLSPEGDPVFLGANSQGVEVMAIYSKLYPVMVNRGGQAPLKPGESRKWAFDIPSSLDGEDVVDIEKFGVRVTAVRFSD